MTFNRSLLSVQQTQPWKYTTQPTYNPDGSELTPGVKQTLDGVFILADPAFVAMLKQTLTAAEKTELQGWVYPNLTEAQCALWHVPVWSGNTSAFYFRVPSTIWADPSTPPPAKVKQFFAALWNAASAGA